MTDLATQLRRALDGRWAHVRQETREDLGAERFAPPSEGPRPAGRPRRRRIRSPSQVAL